jgi:hypothetical protein
MKPRPQCGANVVNRVGKKYGKLTVIKRSGSKDGYAIWLCECECGVTRDYSSASLRANPRISCGCSRKTGKGSRANRKKFLPPGEAAKRTIHKGYRISAKNRGIVWVITKGRVFHLITQPCHYCGSMPRKVRKVSTNGEFRFNGIDRVDNALGYTTNNTVTCCHLCNHAKCQMSKTEFLSWVSEVYRHSVSNK